MKKAFVVLVLVGLMLSLLPVPSAASANPVASAAPEDLPLRFVRWVLTMLRNIGAVVVVIGFVINGYKLALSPDPRAHAEAYSGIVKTAIGALLVFGAHLLASWLESVVSAI